MSPRTLLAQDVVYLVATIAVWFVVPAEWKVLVGIMVAIEVVFSARALYLCLRRSDA